MWTKGLERCKVKSFRGLPRRRCGVPVEPTPSVEHAVPRSWRVGRRNGWRSSPGDIVLTMSQGAWPPCVDRKAGDEGGRFAGSPARGRHARPRCPLFAAKDDTAVAPACFGFSDHYGAHSIPPTRRENRTVLLVGDED